MPPTNPDDTERDSGDTRNDRKRLIECLNDVEKAKRNLPYALDRLGSDEQSVRLLAATVCCLVVVETEDRRCLAYLVRRLNDRLAVSDVPLELTLTLDYLSSEYPRQFESILDEIQGEGNGKITGPPGTTSFTRTYYSRLEAYEGSGYRSRTADDSSDEISHETVTDRQREERKKREHERRREAEHEEETEATDSTEPDLAPDTGDGDDEHHGVEGPKSMVRRTTEISTLAVRSRFDEIHIRGERREGRFATVYEALVGQGGNQRAVGLRLLYRPGSEGNALGFDGEIENRLRRWTTVDDHERILSLLDWGIEPRPWIATPLGSETLEEREPTEFAPALETAVEIVDAVSYSHRNDVVHGGIDASNVVYPTETFDDVTDQTPRIDNVGLIHVFREYFEPANYLDPRYAPPEYYSERYGQVDHTTDIYQLGAVCYRLFTGQPPYDGDFRTIRTSVLESEPTPPSDIREDIPREIDDVISKAMAKQKIRRYETVEHLHRELESMGEENSIFDGGENDA